MRSLAWFEARKVARNPLLWLGALLLFALAVLNAWGYWPTVPQDAEYVHEGLVVLAPFALLAGAALGLRDETSGAANVVSSTPLAGRSRIVPARLLAVATVALLSCVVAFAATWTTSIVRGGHGVPDAFLVLDASLYVALAGAAGFGIGRLTGSRIMSLLAAPLLPAFAYFLQGRQTGRVTDPSWLLPSPVVPGYFGPLGYLPDVFAIHSVYLLGGLLVLGGGIWIAVARREGAGSVHVPVAVTIAGSLTVVAAGAWLVTQPFEVHVMSAARSTWVEIHSPRDYDLLPRTGASSSLSRFSGPADRALATECAEAEGIVACVFPEYGTEFARAVVRDAAPLAEVASLEGIPRKLRMVPVTEESGVNQCAGGDDELLLTSTRWSREFEVFESTGEAAFYCAIYGPRLLDNPAAEPLRAWFSVRVVDGLTGDEYVKTVRQNWGPWSLGIVEHLADVPVAEVVERLEPVWDEVRRRELTRAELRAALRG